MKFQTSSRLIACSSALLTLAATAWGLNKGGSQDSTTNRWPTTVSAHPTGPEWHDANPVQFTYRSADRFSKSCEASQVREWLKIRCREQPTAAMRLLGGEGKHIYYWIQPPSTETDGMPGESEIVMAIRPGDRRVIAWWTFAPGYDGPLTVTGSMTLQQDFQRGDEYPTLILSSTLHEPIRTATQEGK